LDARFSGVLSDGGSNEGQFHKNELVGVQTEILMASLLDAKSVAVHSDLTLRLEISEKRARVATGPRGIAFGLVL
jgi:hypothetical protein